jgi:hypothetical protein
VAANAGDSRAVLFTLPATDAVFGFSDSVVKVRQTAANFGNGSAGSLEDLGGGGNGGGGGAGSSRGARVPGSGSNIRHGWDGLA